MNVMILLKIIKIKKTTLNLIPVEKTKKRIQTVGALKQNKK